MSHHENHSPMNTLLLTKLRFTLTFTQDTYLLPFIGNTLRGALGHSLHDNFPQAYDAVFKVTNTDSTPNPFVISAPYPSQGSYLAGDTLPFTLTLFGTACAYDEIIIDAVKQMCQGKLSGATLSEAAWEFTSTWSDTHAETIPPCDALTLAFTTPTEFISHKKTVYEPDFVTFIDSLFGRISGIVDTYSQNEFVLPYALIAKKPLIDATYNLTRVHISSKTYPLDGFVGSIRYSGDLTRYLPYIDLGSQLHVGKKTTRSCGEYRLDIG